MSENKQLFVLGVTCFAVGFVVTYLVVRSLT